MTKVYYNEFDPKAAAWLRELIKNGAIAKGDVDDRSITEVKPKDLQDYTQCHFFAGIGGWALALEQAGWGNKPVWTGSCPCQPFSTAGQQAGFKDERHLWPVFFGLIRECLPSVVFGEQVASAIGKGWLDLVCRDLEQEDYACGAAVLTSECIGGPHIRQRLYWLADTASKGLERPARPSLPEQTHDKFDSRKSGRQEKQTVRRPSDSGDASGGDRPKVPAGKGFWEEWEWLSFRDGKRRPVESSSFPLVDGVPNRLGRLRGYGNALCVPTAQTFVEAYRSL